jgi:ligand-binding sensor domain-containing protein
MKVKQLLVFLFVCHITFISCEKEKPNQKESNSWDVFTTQNGLFSNLVNCLIEDSSGTIWAGTNRGLCMLKDSVWKLVSSYNLNCRSLSLGGDGVIVGTDFGIGTIKNDGLLFIQEGLNIAELEYINDNYWFTISNYFNNLFTSNGQNISLIKDGPFGDIYQLNSGVVLISSPGLGIYIFNQNAEYLNTTVTSADGLSSDWCNVIYQNSLDEIWIGTNSEKGLCEILNDTIICYDFPYIKSIDEDKEGNLWLGSELFGVYKWETNGNRINYTMLDGLPSNRITDLLVAQDGSVWVSTEDAGVARYQP